MKKLMTFLFAAFAVLSSQAAGQTVRVDSYRLGTDPAFANDNLSSLVSPVSASVYKTVTATQTNEVQFVVAPPAGQKLSHWVKFDKAPSTTQPVNLGAGVTNAVNEASPSFTWSYTTDGTVYLVLDFDYINYSLSYNGNGGSGSMPPESHVYTNKFNLAENAFERTGYTFDGWTNSVVTTPLADGAHITSGSTFDVSYTNKTAELFAKWDPNQYEVTFNPNCYGFPTNVVTVTYDRQWSEYFPDIERTGYALSGWFTEKTGGTPVSGSVDVTSNTTLYAHWNAHTFTVVLHPNYGDGTDQFKEQGPISYGEDKALTLGATLGFAKTGYAFSGWATASDGAVVYQDGAAAGYMTDTEDYVNLYAVWEPITYTISFSANGGTGEMLDIENVSYDAEVMLPACAFEKSGVDFKGWRLGDDLYADQAMVSNLTATAGATIVLTAVWSEKCYVEYEANGGDGVMETQTFEAEDLPKSLASNEFAKVGYTFFGWATNVTDAAALKKSYSDGQTFETFAALPAAAGESATLYAVWQTNAYTVVFNPNCSRYTGEMSDMSLYYDQSTNLTANAFVNEEGLHFSGWSNSVTGVTYANGAEVSNLTAEANGVVVLDAIWDNGELSRAMHCDNLYWEAFPQWEDRCWTAAFEQGVGCESDSCAMSDSSLAFMITTVKTNGTLRFKWKAGQTTGPSLVRYANDATTPTAYSVITNLVCTESDVGNEAWLDTGDILIDKAWIQEGRICIGLRCPSSMTMFVDQLTWLPEGPEPAEDTETVNFSQRNALVNGEVSDNPYFAYAGGTYVKRGHAAPRVTFTADSSPVEGILFDGWELMLGESVYDIDDNPIALDGNATCFMETTNSTCSVRAKFKWLEYRIDYDANDGHGTVEPDSSSYVYTNEVALASAIPSAGYSFAGWTTNTTGGTVFAPGQVVTGADIGASASGPVALYANWTQNVYTVTFSYRDSEGAATNTVRTVLGTESAEPPDSASYDSWPGHKFTGWDSDYTNVVADVIVNALYEEGQSFHVRFEPGEGATGTMGEMKYIADVAQGIASNAFAKVGYIFAGWATEKDGEVVYADGQVVVFEADATLYAVWEPISYVVEFDPNGGSGAAMAAQEFVYDEAQPLAECEFTAELAFLGWATNAEGGVVYADMETVSNMTAEDGATVTLYAVWVEPLSVGDYFKATLAELGYDVPTDGKTAYSVTAKGLPAGLSLKYNAAVKNKSGKVTKPAKVEWWIEGVPTSALNFDTNPAYLVIAVNGQSRTLPLPIKVAAQDVVQLDDLALGESVNEQYYLPGVKKGWTVTGLPTGLKYTAKLMTTTKKSGRKTVVVTNALPYSVYGKTTKAGRYTVTAKKKTGSYYETMKYRVLVHPKSVNAQIFSEGLTNLTTMAYVPVAWNLTNDVSSVGGKVAKVAGLPTGLSFAASTVYGYANAKTKKGKYVKQAAQTIVGTPTKTGVYVVTFTKNVTTGTGKNKKTVAKTAQILWTVTANDAELELGFNEDGGVVESGMVGLKYDGMLAFAATDGATVTASGLPTGIKLVDLGGGQWGFTGYTTKTGTYLVTVKAVLNGKSVTQRLALKISGLPAWAKGTYNGYVGGASDEEPGLESTNGLATVTVSAVGKISGKFQEHGTNWTLSASCYTAAAETFVCTNVVATYSYKVTTKVNGKTKTVTKKLTRKFALEVSQDPLGGVASLVEEDGATVSAWQNLWGRADYKALGNKLFYTSKAKPYRIFSVKIYNDEDGRFYLLKSGDDTTGLTYFAALSLKATPNGNVTATLSFDTGKTTKDAKTKKTVKVIYKPTCSTVVIPATAADDDIFAGEAFLYFKPSAGNNFPGFSGVATF